MSNAKVTENDYLFLSAALRARETRMLGRERIERMLEAEAFSDAARILTDCGYADMSDMGAEELEVALSARRAELFNELGRIAPEQQLIDAFRLKYDYHNAKALIKAERSNADTDHLLSESGRVSPEKMKEAFNNDDYRDLPPALAEAIKEAAGILARTGNPQLADFSMDKAYFAELLSLAEGLSSSFLRDYVKLQIDTANLRAAVRTLRMGRGENFLKTALIPGGNVKPDGLAAAAAAGEGIGRLFSSTPLAEAAVIGEEATKGGSLTEFELSCDNAAMKFIKRAKSKSFGSELVVAYLAAIENEITSARMILTGKLSGINPELIRERLRETYA
ncbi:MAG TPA: V-type ATPase subunit [Clostridiales bacterium]|nr:V-type ATPase subunit [Clostridiales bacterium]